MEKPSRSARLLLDEMETGIHYNLKQLSMLTAHADEKRADTLIRELEEKRFVKYQMIPGQKAQWKKA